GIPRGIPRASARLPRRVTKRTRPVYDRARGVSRARYLRVGDTGGSRSASSAHRAPHESMLQGCPPARR
ncbi:MAG: hypothetical protein KDK91_32470, partial [Gammaproteobacteria bacterium]|nr:hypothetical protein [Gammaproteobacteria bacterium]